MVADILNQKELDLLWSWPNKFICWFDDHYNLL